VTVTPPVLARARELVLPALRQAVAQLTPRLRLPTEYHFGWVEPDGTPIPPGAARTGKAVRPALAVLGAEAAGGAASAAVPGAVAMELIHNFSLIHDDIMDGDKTRHHRPTVWDVYGVSEAILVGDAVHTLAFQVLESGTSSSPYAAAALRSVTAATAAMITGQAQDADLDGRLDGTLAECIEMERNKTGALLAGSIGVGAVLAGAGPEVVRALEQYGFELGLAFQAVDDVLGIWGDPDATGKPVGNDLRERKKSVPVMLALESGGRVADAVRDAFATSPGPHAVAALSDLLADAGIRDRTIERARTHLDAALATIATQAIEPGAATELETLARFVVEREY
jgi:geranylgeranyl diphosphate synthase type I